MKTTTTDIPTVHCVAALDDVIRDRLPALRAGDVVARWWSGEGVVIRGRRPSRGWTAALFGASYVRWECVGKGKGLTQVPEGAVAHLPVVR